MVKLTLVQNSMTILNRLGRRPGQQSALSLMTQGDKGPDVFREVAFWEASFPECGFIEMDGWRGSEYGCKRVSGLLLPPCRTRRQWMERIGC